MGFDNNQKQRYEVIVTNIKMPLWSMILFMVKWVIASIPAILILFFLGMLMTGIYSGFVKFLALSP